jgi:thymidylate synthase (FAD)
VDVKLIRFTPDPDKTCAAAALGCRSDKAAFEFFDGLSDAKVKNILRETIKRGHHSVIEHASFTFSVRGVSRALTHQLVRHRIASYSQQSQRHVRLDEPTYVAPVSIQEKPGLKEKYDRFMEGTWNLYREFVDEGIPEEDARFVLPNATTSNIVITMNARELVHFFNLRCCVLAQWEIREMANLMLALAKEAAPIIFENAGPPCDACPEPDFECELRNIDGEK